MSDSIYAFTRIGMEFLMHIQIFIPMEVIFFLKRIQQSNNQNDDLENSKVILLTFYDKIFLEIKIFYTA